MNITIRSYAGIEAVGIELDSKEARAFHFGGIPENLMENARWAEQQEPIAFGPSDQSEFFVSIDGAEEQDLKSYDSEYHRPITSIDDEYAWVEAISYQVGSYEATLRLGEEFHPENLTIHFDHVFDNDYGVVSHMTYNRIDGSVIEVLFDECETRPKSEDAMLHNVDL